MTSLDEEMQRFFARSAYYAQADIQARISNDITTAVATFRFAHKVATWGDTSQKKLCIYGALPFAFKSTTFALPVQVWLSQSYPIDPPTIFVVPAEDNHRLVANHRAVDGTGLCYCPALASWNPQESTVKRALIQLVKIFSYCPPLWEDDDAPGVSNSGAGSAAQSAAAAAVLTSTGVDGEVDEDARLCVVCLSDPKDTVLVPCGHCCTCNTCASSLTLCPMCRAQIQYRQRVYV